MRELGIAYDAETNKIYSIQGVEFFPTVWLFCDFNDVCVSVLHKEDVNKFDHLVILELEE